MSKTTVDYYKGEPVNPAQFQREDGYYEYPAPVWDKAKCEKMARSWATDGMGTKYPFQGYIGCSTTPGSWGRTRYNGGTVINDEWYKGIIRHLPKVAEGFKIVYILSWGFRIVKG